MNKEKTIIKILKDLEQDNVSTEIILKTNPESDLDFLKNLERTGFIQRTGNSTLLSSCDWEITKEGKSFIKFYNKLESDSKKINNVVMTLPPIIKKEILEKYPEINLTDGVVKELFESAEEELKILSPYIDASLINYFQGINPKVKIRFLTTLSKYGGKNSILERLKQSRDNFEIKYLHESKNNIQQFQIHAKVIIADKSKIYVGSANFTDTSMLYNLESGILSTDEQLIKSYSEIFDEIYLSI